MSANLDSLNGSWAVKQINNETGNIGITNFLKTWSFISIHKSSKTLATTLTFMAQNMIVLPTQVKTRMMTPSPYSLNRITLAGQTSDGSI